MSETGKSKEAVHGATAVVEGGAPQAPPPSMKPVPVLETAPAAGPPPADEAELEPVDGTPGAGPEGLLEADLLEASFALLAPSAEALVDRFYFRLFRAAPETYHMFPQGRFADQKKKLLAALKLVVNNARRPDAVVPVVRELGAKHVGYGVAAEHYPLVGSILLATLAEFAGEAWTDDLQRAWADAYRVVSSVMLEAAA